MSTRAIDYDRPCIIKTDNGTNMDIFMYKDRPGHYLNAFGKPVSEELARKAGFDVQRYSKQRIRQERLAAATEKVNAELELNDEDFRKPNIVANYGNYNVIRHGDSDHHAVHDVDGNVLTPNAVLSRKICDTLAREMGLADKSYTPAPLTAQPQEAQSANLLAAPGDSSGKRDRSADRGPRASAGPDTAGRS